MTERLRCRDFTEAMTRPHVLSRLGPGEHDRLPARLRPTNQQALIVLGLVVGVGWLAWRVAAGPVLGGVVPWPAWMAVCVVAAFVVAPLWHVKPFDERTLPRSVQSIGGARLAAHGKATGPWTVHGVAQRNRRRPAARPEPTLIPAREEAS